MQYNDYSTNPFGAPTTPPLEYLRIGFGKRFVAFLIDVLITLTVTFGLGILYTSFDLGVAWFIQAQIDSVLSFYEMMGFSRNTINSMESLLGGVMVASIAVGVFYPLIEGITGASPGKRVLRIIVAAQDGRRGSISIFLKRYVIKNLGTLLQLLAFIPALAFIENISFIVGLVMFFGYLGALSSARLALHDLIAQTAVYHVEDVR